MTGPLLLSLLLLYTNPYFYNPFNTQPLSNLTPKLHCHCPSYVDPVDLRTPIMCIALISTAHPSYSLIVIDNRDVFIATEPWKDSK
jgi:hypothetical protein